MTVDLPAELVTSGTALPDVCARHGEPATAHRKVRFSSYTPRWTYLLILFGLLPFLIVVGFVQKRVTARQWPFCDRCRRLSLSRLLTGLGLIVLAVLAVVVQNIAFPASDGGPLLLVAAGLFFAGLVTAGYSAMSSIAQGHVSDDGTLVRLKAVHPRFAERLSAVMPSQAQPCPQVRR